jgi:hypothetical protein
MVSLSIIPSRRKSRFLTATIERIPEARSRQQKATSRFFNSVDLCWHGELPHHAEMKMNAGLYSRLSVGSETRNLYVQSMTSNFSGPGYL